MSVGFRKSLFGFNCSDVLEYIEKTHKSFVKKEKDLNEKIEETLNELNLSKAESEKILAEKCELDRKLNEFMQKYEDIERLSENIGKLYLVAQANAQSIMESSQNSALIAAEQVNKNISSIDEAHESLQALRQSITETSDNFVAEVDRLIKSLADTKEQINKNTENEVVANAQFHEIYETIVK